MSKIFSIIQHDDFTEIRFMRSPTAQDGLEAIKEQAALGEVQRKRLWDMSCGYALSKEELQRAAITSRATEMPENSKVAVVAPDDLSFGISRMYSVQQNDPRGRSQHHVFREREEAIAWLKEPDDENQGLA